MAAEDVGANERAITRVPPHEHAHVPSIVDASITGVPIRVDDRPWIPTFYGEQKYLRVSLTTGEWVLLARIHPGQPVPYHKHHGGLNLWVLDGELDRVALVGHDWGAEIGFPLVARAPDRFTCFVALAVPHPAGYAVRRAVFS